MGTGQSSVSFTNSYGKKIFVAYMRRDFSYQSECGDIWDVLGWIGLDPGETESRANPTTNRWFYYLAEAVDGAVWAGPFVADVEQQAFEKCTALASSSMTEPIRGTVPDSASSTMRRLAG
jgi:hypothetical protein